MMKTYKVKDLMFLQVINPSFALVERDKKRARAILAAEKVTVKTSKPYKLALALQTVSAE